MRIFGSGFIAGLTTVKFGSAAATNIEYVSSAELRVSAPANASGTADIEVSTPGGASSLEDAFHYLELPSLTAVEPHKGTSSGGLSVIITGSGFLAEDDIEVTFGDVPATSVTVRSSTSIEAETPAHVPGTVDIEVKTSGGEALLSAGFTYFAAPVVTSFAPATGVAGTVVTITGTNFDPDTAGNTVRFGQLPASVVSATATQLIVGVPANAVTAPITVITGRWNSDHPTVVRHPRVDRGHRRTFDGC